MENNLAVYNNGKLETIVRKESRFLKKLSESKDIEFKRLDELSEKEKEELSDGYSSFDEFIEYSNGCYDALVDVMSDTSGNGLKQSPIIKEVKIQRNDKCPCGSGKKYKKCHL